MKGFATVTGGAAAVVGLVLVCSVVVRPAAGQAADTLVVDGAPVATFADARALDVDPFGRIYVADAGRDVVVQLDVDGMVRATLGGPGSGDGEFDEPAGLDATNGLLLLVADAGNARIQRFSKEHAFLGTLVAGAPGAGSGNEAGRPTYRAGDSDAAALPEGRPVAVLAAGSNEVFAADADRRVVLRWRADRQRVDVIGGHREGEGRLVEPVALATDGTRSLFVADRGRQAVVVFDLYGTYVRTLGEGRLSGIRALVVRDDRLWVVLPDRLVAYDTRGRFEAELPVRLPGPLVDVAFHTRGLLLLTPSALYLAEEGFASAR